MFKFKKKQMSALDSEMDNLIKNMRGLDITSDEYKSAAESYEILSKAKEKNESKLKLSKDTMVTVGGHLAGLILIMSFERVAITTSKAWQHILKLRL